MGVVNAKRAPESQLASDLDAGPQFHEAGRPLRLQVRGAALAIRPRPTLRELLRGRWPVAIPAVRWAELELRDGEVLAIAGANGAGKSTLLCLLAGVCQPASGRVEGMGGATALLALERLGLVARLTVADHLRLHAAPPQTAPTSQALSYALTRWGLDDLRLRPVDALSAGERVRVALGCSLVAGCQLWLLDEVTSVLDDAALAEVLAVLRERGDTVVLAGHDPRARAAADRTLWLQAGRTEAKPLPQNQAAVPQPPPARLPWHKLLPLVAAVTRAPSGLLQRGLLAVGTAVAAWQVAGHAQSPGRVAALLWCGLAALAVQLAVASDGPLRLFGLVRCGLDDVLRARGASTLGLAAACLVPVWLAGMSAAGLAGAVIAWRQGAVPPAAVALDLALAGAAMAGLGLCSWAAAIASSNATPVTWLLHFATVSFGSVTLGQPAAWFGAWLPASLLATALRRMAGLQASPVLVLPALAWLALGLGAAAWAARRLARHGSLGLLRG